VSESSGYLLDTCTALIALSSPESLSPDAYQAIFAGPNFLSVVSYWEVMLKSMKQALDVGDPRTWWSDALDQLAATPLMIRPQHVGKLFDLPPIHKDPFDRMLVAQSLVEGLALISPDAAILQYRSKALRVIG
jgi:PIN domain nuclease of toxin-antitoxin system